VALDEIYKEVILDHYKNPRNKRDLPGAEFTCTRNNPLCGDEITVLVHEDGDTLAEVTFQGAGCSISQSSASPSRIVHSTACRFITGSAPGKPRQTGHVCVFSPAPKPVWQRQNIFEAVRSWAWTSIPMTVSYAIPLATAGLYAPVHEDR